MGNTLTTLQELKAHILLSTSEPDLAAAAESLAAAVDSPTLSFTVKEFVFEYLRGVPTEHVFDNNDRPILKDIVYNACPNGTTAEDMYDEMIRVGISPLGWCQANLPDLMLKHSFITRVALDEDEEPNPNHCGMSFSHYAFLETISEATLELGRADPSKGPTIDDPIPDKYALPDASCTAMYALADMLDEMNAAGLSPCDYVSETAMLLAYCSSSPFMVYMQFSPQLPCLRRAIRKGRIVLYMMLCLELVWKRVEDPATHPLARAFVRVPILSEPVWFSYIRPGTAESKRRFVASLPAIDVSSMAKEDMRCPHCWCNFDEDDEDGIRDSPVHAPCPFGHVYGRSCLLELMLHMDQELMCPLCRHEWHV